MLARVLLPDAEHVPFDQPADARLLIGDAALRSMFDDPTCHYDMGYLWQERTGLPMVYALFATPAPLRPGVVALEEALLEAHRRASAEREQIARETSAEHGYPAGYLARYFEKLRYRFGPREREGLLAFLELAHEAGELARVPELAFVEDVATLSAKP